MYSSSGGGDNDDDGIENDGDGTDNLPGPDTAAAVDAEVAAVIATADLEAERRRHKLAALQLPATTQINKLKKGALVLAASAAGLGVPKSSTLSFIREQFQKLREEQRAARAAIAAEMETN
jgi:hypothetical protein